MEEFKNFNFYNILYIVIKEKTRGEKAPPK
jgi:hypothetical protein